MADETDHTMEGALAGASHPDEQHWLGVAKRVGPEGEIVSVLITDKSKGAANLPFGDTRWVEAITDGEVSVISVVEDTPERREQYQPGYSFTYEPA